MVVKTVVTVYLSVHQREKTVRVCVEFCDRNFLNLVVLKNDLFYYSSVVSHPVIFSSICRLLPVELVLMFAV